MEKFFNSGTKTIRTVSSGIRFIISIAKLIILLAIMLAIYKMMRGDLSYAETIVTGIGNFVGNIL